MASVTIDVSTNKTSRINLGIQGENIVEQVIFNISSWIEEFGEGVAYVYAKRKGDVDPYPVALEMDLDEGTATWDLTAADTAYKGKGSAQLVYVVDEDGEVAITDDEIKKTKVYATTVQTSLVASSTENPDAYDTWLEVLGGYTARVESAKASALASKTAAAASAAAALASQTAAATSESNAASSEANAASSESTATAAASTATAQATAASGSATSAASSASSASASATAAAASATSADTDADRAEAAAESAESYDETYQEYLEDTQTAASTATTAAATAVARAQDASEYASVATQAKSDAMGSASSAAASEAAAHGWQQGAASSSQAAATSAAAASTSATNAATSETNAAASASAAEDSADEAEASASSVSASVAQIETNKNDITQLKEDLSDKTDWVVGSSEQLLSDNYTEDSFPYLFRQSGGNGADREYDEVVGGTVAWNQLAPTNYSKTGNGGASLTSGTPIMANHKLLIAFERSINTSLCIIAIFTRENGTNSNVECSLLADGALSGATIKSVAVSGVSNGTNSNVDGNAWIYQTAGSGTTCTNLQIIDLTAMFGSTIADYIYSLEQANAGAGVAFFRKLFPFDYYEYNAGELMHVSGVSSHDTVGFNQWDEEWEVGAYQSSTGNKTNSSNRIRSKNKIPVLPSTTYYISGGVNASNPNTVYFYDENEAYLGVSNQVARYNATFITPDKAHYMCFNTGVGYGETYKNDICINLSWSGYRNGEYEPYVKHSYPLDDSLILRGIPKLDASNNLYYDGDTYADDGTVTRRYGIVDLGTLNWNYIPTSGQERFVSSSIRNLVKKPATNADNANIISSAYDTFNITHAFEKDKIIAMYIDGDILVRDTSYTDATAFKAAMSGVYLVYELATPTTETAEPYTNPQILSGYGTEGYVSAGIVPVGHNTKYPENLKAKIEGLPWNFATLIAPTETTYTATRNYTTGALFIVNNILYKATANIANGGTITPNTNCTATTLAEVISAL